MKLNYECMRDTLLYLEENLTVDCDGDLSFGLVFLDDLYSELSQYSKEDIYYSVLNLKQAEFLSCNPGNDWPVHNINSISYITFKGHEFLSEIRDNDKWKNVKSILGSVKTFSLSAISAVAEGVTSALIAKHFAGQ